MSLKDALYEPHENAVICVECGWTETQPSLCTIACPKCSTYEHPLVVVAPIERPEWRHAPGQRPYWVPRTGILAVVSRRLRYEVLKRDGYRCQLCGRNPTEDGVKLEVDHKVSRHHGGSNAMDNLHVLCFDCNRGKGTSDL
jgi:5-methylcytosine-specific restriction endonuclease McrA